MHERTSRAIARLLFVFCCALPTLATMTVIAITWTPWYHRRSLAAIEQQLSRQTGLLFEIEDFDRPAPSMVRLHGVRVLESEMMREVARVRVVAWATQQNRVALRLSQPELQSSELAHAWSLIHDRFLCRPEQTSMPVRFAADDLTIHSSTGPLTLRDVDARIRPLARAVIAEIHCLPATSAGDSSPVGISVTRDRSGESPTTDWTLQTGETALPCSALAEFLPILDRIGQDASFSGQLHWSVDSNGWSLDLGGSHLAGVDLSRISQRLPHRLTGQGKIQLDRCLIQPGQTVDISGSLRAEDGYVGASLLKSLKDQLGFRLVSPPQQPRDVGYDRMALRFDLFGAQLKLRGICRTERGYEGLRPGVALCAGGQPLVLSPDQTLPAVRLASALAPSHSVMVPLAQQTSGLMDLLLAPSHPLPADPQPANSGPAARITATGRWLDEPSIEQP